MTPDDPRHGTVAGYNRIPCREECCKRAMATYKARWAWDRHNGRERRVSTIGTRRRIESLAWLGWSRAEIAKRAGMHATNMHRLFVADTMTISLAARFAALYEELCMTLPTGNPQAIANTRNRARARGAVPPLAWDNIDDPDEQPQGVGYVDNSDRPSAIRDAVAMGWDAHETCRRLEVSWDALEKWCARNGLRDEWRVLVGRVRTEVA